LQLVELLQIWKDEMAPKAIVKSQFPLEQFWVQVAPSPQVMTQLLGLLQFIRQFEPLQIA
jgi:hypothetical protein